MDQITTASLLKRGALPLRTVHLQGYFYTRLSPSERAAYDRLLTACRWGQSRVLLKNVGQEEVQSAWEAMERDVPEIFFLRKLTGLGLRLPHGPMQVRLHRRYGPETIADRACRMEARARALLAGSEALPEQERIRWIHDCLIRTVTYGDPEGETSHTAEGPLLEGRGVCEGISKAFQYLADRAGLDCCLAEGVAEGEPHCWNLVRCGGVRYHVDVTFDLGLSAPDGLRWDYFLLSDRQLAADHGFSGLPPCPRDFDFYRQQGLFLPAGAALRRLIAREMPHRRRLVFQLPPFRETGEQAASAVLRFAAQTVPGLPLQASCNAARGIFELERCGETGAAAVESDRTT